MISLSGIILSWRLLLVMAPFGGSDMLPSAFTSRVRRYFDPKYWTMENPQSGRLKDQSVVAELPFDDIDYCKYGLPYRTRARLWSNLDCWTPRTLCRRDCGSMTEDKKYINRQLSEGQDG